MDGYKFNGYTYLETLETEEASVLPETLIITETPTIESIFFRLVLGTLSIYVDSEDQIIAQKISYTKITDEFDDTTLVNPIREWVGDEFGYNDLDNYFKIHNFKNKMFFEELLTEFTLYFLNKSKGNHVSAFLNLYRALEYISYSFPMVFSSKASNYFQTFDTLRSFFTNKSQGQLKFFNEFVKILFEKSTLRCGFTIDTYVGNKIIDDKKRKVIQTLCSEFKYSDDGSIIRIDYNNVLDFMVNLRNRYFHFESDRKNNISNINFDSELFFAGLNDKFANWLSMIYLEIVIHGVYKLNLMSIT